MDFVYIYETEDLTKTVKKPWATSSMVRWHAIIFAFLNTFSSRKCLLTFA